MAKSMSITSRYQVTVPKDVRDALGLSSDDSLVFRLKDGEVWVEKAPQLSDIQARAQKLIRKRGVGQVTDKDMSRAREIFNQEGLRW